MLVELCATRAAALKQAAAATATDSGGSGGGDGGMIARLEEIAAGAGGGGEAGLGGYKNLMETLGMNAGQEVFEPTSHLSPLSSLLSTLCSLLSPLSSLLSPLLKWHASVAVPTAARYPTAACFGLQMAAAVGAAEAQGLPVVLGDRPIEAVRNCLCLMFPLPLRLRQCLSLRSSDYGGAAGGADVLRDVDDHECGRLV